MSRGKWAVVLAVLAAALAAAMALDPRLYPVRCCLGRRLRPGPDVPHRSR